MSERDTRAPFFSILLPCHDAEGTLGAAIDAVLTQDLADFELIVVDDGSTDGGAAVAARAAATDSRIVVASHDDNLGCAAARATAASLARGRWVMKIDADDILLPGALSTMARAIAENPGYQIHSATGYKVYPDGSHREALNDPRFLSSCSLDLADLLDDCWIFGGAATIKRETLERVGGFRPAMRCEDWDLWLRALAAGARHHYVPEHIYLYTQGLPGRMNEDPTHSFRSYIHIIEDLIASGTLDEEHAAIARDSVERFRARIAELEETGTTVAEYTDAQARAFKERVYRLFGKRRGDRAILAANRFKGVVRPLRVALARRRRERDAR